MTNQYDLKMLDAFAPWADSKPAVENLPSAKLVSSSLRNSVNLYAQKELDHDLRLWTLQGYVFNDSLDEFFSELADISRWSVAGHTADMFIDRCLDSVLSRTTEIALITNARNLGSISTERISRLWGGLTVEQKAKLLPYAELTDSIAHDALDNGLSSPVLIPWARSTDELDRIATPLFWIEGHVDDLMDSEHFQLSTAKACFTHVSHPQQAADAFGLIAANLEHAQITRELAAELGVTETEPINRLAPPELALDSKRVRRRQGLNLQDIINAEVPYRIYAKPYKDLVNKISRDGEHSEVEQSVLMATNEYLKGLQIMDTISRD